MACLSRQPHKRFFSVATIISFAFTSIFCLALSSILLVCHGHEAVMPDMNTVMHLEHWQSVTISEALPTLLALEVIFFALVFLRRVCSVQRKEYFFKEISWQYFRRGPPEQGQSYFISLFSSGILHTKIFPA